MKEKEERIGNTASQKEKIRQRYKGIDSDELDIVNVNIRMHESSDFKM